MRHYKNILYVIFLLSVSHTLYSQDPHFSQFYASPLLLNPALTGTSEGNYRVSAIYRDQWRSALENPFRTYSVTGDVNYQINSRADKTPDKFGVGLSFFGDRVNTFDLNTTAITLYGAYHKVLDRNSRSILSGGLYIGVGQKNLNYEDLTFQDEFNSIDGYTFPSGEFLPTNNFGYADMGLGINYSFAASTATHFHLGIGTFHLNSPNISFYKNDISNNPDLIKTNELDPKYSIHAAATLMTTERLSIQPRVIALIQDQNIEYSLGNNFRYLLDYDSGTYLYVGPYLRLIENLNGLRAESAILAVGIEKGKLLLGLSYDHNLSDITGTRSGLGAFEVSVSFRGNFDNAEDYCPEF